MSPIFAPRRGVCRKLVFLLCFAWTAISQADPTVSLLAVKKNGVAIMPTSSVISALPGDVYECEIYVAGVDGYIDVVSGYNITLAGRAGVESAATDGNGCGLILPVGWHAPLDPIVCQIDSDCTTYFPYTVCQHSGGAGTCVATDHHPEQGAFVTTSRPDFIFAGYTFFGGIDTQTLDYVVAFQANIDGSFESLVPYYVGTLKLQVHPSAAGTFTFGFVEGMSFVFDNLPQRTMLPLRGVSLLIHTASLCEPPFVQTDPPACAIDARYPNDPANSTTRYGFDSMIWSFSRDPGALTPTSFQLSTVPTGVGVPVISNVQKNGTQVTLTFDRVMPSTRWTCVKALFGEQDVACIGALGADTDASRQSGATDTQALIDALDGTPSLQIWQSDLDRSAGALPPGTPAERAFTPLDILASIDMLNGAGALNAFNGLSLTACPTVGVP